MIVPVVIGLCIIAVILLEAFETIILPRRVTRRFRLTRAFYVSLWVPTRAVARLIDSTKKRESFLSFFGPLSLLILFALWAASLIIGFGFLYYGTLRMTPPAHRLKPVSISAAPHSSPWALATSLPTLPPSASSPSLKAAWASDFSR